VKPGFDPSKGIPLKLEIGDRDMWEFTTGDIALPSVVHPPAVSEASGAFKVSGESRVLAAPLATSPVLADAHKGVALTLLAKAGEFYKVEWAKGRVGFIPAADGTVEAAHVLPPKLADGKVSQAMDREPPLINLDGIDTTKSPVVVDGERYKLNGDALDPNGIQDIRIFVNNEKVFFRTASAVPTDATAPKTKAGPRMNFATDFPLKSGNNTVLVVVRQNDDLLSQKTLVIHRRAPAFAQDSKAHANGPNGE
jgi:carboxyl-terminal processing protease